MNVLGTEALRRFEQRLVDWLEEKHMGKFIELGQEGAGLFVKRGIGLARSHGFESFAAMQSFFALMLEAGDRFEEWLDDSGPAGILADRSLSADSRLQLLYLEIAGRIPEE